MVYSAGFLWVDHGWLITTNNLMLNLPSLHMERGLGSEVTFPPAPAVHKEKYSFDPVILGVL